MKSRFALASLLATSVALAACGWLLPDGELEVTASDAGTQAEDSGLSDTGSLALDSGSTVADAGDPTWGEPVLLRVSSTGTLCVRRGLHPDAGEIYFSEGNQIYYAENASAAAQPIKYADSGFVLNGFSPSPSYFLTSPALGFQNIRGMQVSGILDKTTVGEAFKLDVGIAVVRPYSTRTTAALYFDDNTSIYRSESAAPTKVVFVGRENTPTLSIQRYPVVTTNETIIYFTEGLAGQIWTARRVNQSGTTSFIDAHPVFPSWTTTDTPTEVSEDGKELIFTREGLDGGSTSYLVKQR